jgi:hypothetical protein
MVGPDDEYDSYIDPTLTMLSNHVSVDDLAAYLEHTTSETMGLGTSNASHQRARAFAQHLIRWFGGRDKS